MALVSKNFSDIVTFTRASTATYFNASGVLSSAASGAPRLDFDPVTLAARGLLIEEQRTNLLTFSEQFNNAAWGVANGSISADAVTSPSGATDADKLVEDTSSLAHFVGRSYTTTAADHTFSVFVKAAGRTRIVLAATADARGVGFDLSTGSTFTQAYTVSQGTGSITSLGNGWYRCAMTWTATAVSNALRIVLNDGATQTYAGDGASGIYLWGAQLEAGSFATSYIPTTTAQATRAADVATINALSPWFNAAEGTLYLEGSQIGGKASATIVSIQDSAGTTEYARIRQSAGGTQVLAQISTASGTSAGLATTSFTNGTTFKFAMRIKGGSHAASMNGSAASTSATPANAPTVDRVTLSSSNNTYFRKIIYYPVGKTDSELATLTA